jgi:hypothetical protein
MNTGQLKNTRNLRRPAPYSNLHSEIHFASIGVKVSLADIYKRGRFSENLLEIEREE